MFYNIPTGVKSLNLCIYNILKVVAQIIAKQHSIQNLSIL